MPKTTKTTPPSKAPPMETAHQNLADLETSEIETLFDDAVEKAKAKLFAQGLPVTGERDGRIVREYPDGRIEVIEEQLGVKSEVDLDVA